MLEKQGRNEEEVVIISKKTKLNYRFHNPNTPEATADYIIKVFVEVNQKKVDRILREEALKNANMEVKEESRYVG